MTDTMATVGTGWLRRPRWAAIALVLLLVQGIGGPHLPAQEPAPTDRTGAGTASAAPAGPETPAGSPTALPTAPAVAEVKPEIWYLRDARGGLLPAPGFGYEDFVELLRLREGLPARPQQPEAVLEKLAIDATVEERICRIAAVCQIDCTRSRWASVFLALDPLVLDRPPEHAGEGRFLLEPLGGGGVPVRMADDDSLPRGPTLLGGYRAWFEGGAADAGGGRHTLRLSGIVPVERSGDSRTLRLWMPAATTSVLTLRTTLVDPIVEVHPERGDVTVEPLPATVAAVPADSPPDAATPAGEPADGGPADAADTAEATALAPGPPGTSTDTGGSPAPKPEESRQTRSAEGNQGSLVTVLGLSGPVELRLTPRGGGAGSVDRPAQVVGEVIVRIDGRKAISDVTLSIAGLPARSDRVRVRLPRGAAVTSVRPPARSLGTAGGDGSLAEFSIERKEDGGAVLEFSCESRVDPSGREPLETLAYAVEGIAGWRQWGRASVVVDGDWQVDWEPVAGNRRVDPPNRLARPDPAGPGGQGSPDEVVSGDSFVGGDPTAPVSRAAPQGFAGAFAYDSQPATMPLRVRPLGSRMAVEPEYRYAVGASRIELDARLRLSVRGAPVTRFEITLPGWAIDDVGPAGLVDTARLAGENGTLLIPLVRPLSGNATIELRAGRAIEPDAAIVDWSLPLPRADLVGPAAVTIVPQTNIELVPDAERTTGLVRQVVAQPTGRPAEPGTLAYRMEGSEARFQATRRFLDRRLDAAASVRAVIGVDDTVVEEVIRLDVAYQPLEIVQLSVPRSILETGTLELRHNGLLLSVLEEPVAAAADAPNEAPLEAADPIATVRTVLPVPLLGSGELRVRYVLPTPAVPPDSTVAGELPLVVPLGARLARQSLAIEPQAGLSVDVRGDQWKRDLLIQGAAVTRSWTAVRLQSMVPLAIATEGTTGLGETVIEAAWMSTLVLPDRVEDRFRYRIASASPVLTLTLPPVTAAADGTREPRDSGGDPAAAGERLGIVVDGRTTTATLQSGGRLSVELSPGARSTPHVVEIERVRPRPGLMQPLVLEPPRFAPGTVERRFFWEVRLESDDHLVHAPAAWNSQQAWRWTSVGPVWEPLVSQAALWRWLSGSAAVEPDSLTPKERRSVYSGIGHPGRAGIMLMPTWLLVLTCSGPILAVVLSLQYARALRRPGVWFSLAGLGIAAAAAMPDQIPLIVMASLPGLLLGAVAAGLRPIVEEPARSSGGLSPADRAVVGPRVSTGSSTRLVAPVTAESASLVISSSIAGRPVAGGERNAS